MHHTITIPSLLVLSSCRSELEIWSVQWLVGNGQMYTSGDYVKRITVYQSQRYAYRCPMTLTLDTCWKRADDLDEVKRNSLVHACPSSFFPYIRLDSRITRQYRRDRNLTLLRWSISNVDIRLYTCLSRRCQSRKFPLSRQLSWGELTNE